MQLSSQHKYTLWFVGVVREYLWHLELYATHPEVEKGLKNQILNWRHLWTTPQNDKYLFLLASGLMNASPVGGIKISTLQIEMNILWHVLTGNIKIPLP
jgi:hypothetical protein